MIGREILDSGSVWALLLSIYKDLAERTRQKACACGGSRYNMMLSSGGGS